MRTIRRIASILVVVPAIVAALVATGGAAGAAPSSPAGLGPAHPVPLALGGLARARYLGAARPGVRHTVGVFLNRPDPAGEQRLYASLYDPASPMFHRFLTPAQFTAEFGVPRARTQAVEKWLRSGGLRIASVTGTGDYLTVSGTAAQLGRLFQVHIGRYQLGGTSFTANDRAPRVPASLPVEAVVGLDSLHRFTPSTTGGSGLAAPGPASALGAPGLPAVPGVTPTGPAPAPSALRAPAPGTPALSVPATPVASGPTASVVGAAKAAVGAGSFAGILKPSDLWGVYDLPASDLGQGQTAGMFGEGDPNPVINNLRLFEQHFGLPKVPVRVVRSEPGSANEYGDNAGNIEWYLDTQAITGMAPNLNRLDLYFAKSLFDADIYADLAKWANDPKGPAQMNASFGECETDPTNPVTGPLAQQPYGTELGDNLEVQLGGEQVLRQATIEGRTLFSSTGDTGSGCPELVAPVAGAGNGLAIQPVPDVSYPAASDYAVAVGGTVLTVGDPPRTQRQSEVSWTFTGGGSSHFIAEPSFQKSVAAVSQACLSKPDGSSYSGTQICRGVPDVSDLSGNVTGNGYSIYIDGNLSSEGGTSLSSPLMVGMWSRIQAAAAQAGRHNLGFADPSLYAAARAPGTFYDVTQGETPLGNGAYQPAAGWDYTSGLGAPDVSKLIAAIVKRTPRLSGATALGAPTAVCTATVTSPANNATDPLEVQLGNQPGFDLTSASLSASRSTVAATFTGPAVSALDPPTATAGRDLYLLWSWAAAGKTPVEWFLDAHVDNTGGVTVTSGRSSASAADSPEQYTPSASTAATYTLSGSTLTVRAPLSEVGSPPAGALLSYPFAVVQDDVGNPNAAGSPWAAETFAADTASAPAHGDAALGLAARVGC
jgi:pseudomonalisin